MRFKPYALVSAAVACLLMILPLSVSAQQAQRFEDFEIHYNAIPTGLLNDAVAQEYGIVRSRTQGMLMITILHDSSPIRGRVRTLAIDDDEQVTEVRMREVKNDDWVSYIGTLEIKAGQPVNFSVEVRPETGDGPFDLGWRQTFQSLE